MIQPGMTKKEFKVWKTEWKYRIPKCKNFICCHEMTSCAIDYLCSEGSIWETYSRQKHPMECTGVGCADCMSKYTCKEIKNGI